MHGVEQPTLSSPVPAAFPDPRVPTHDATVILTGHDPNERRGPGVPPPHPTLKPSAHERVGKRGNMSPDTLPPTNLYYFNPWNPPPPWAPVRPTPLGLQED